MHSRDQTSLQALQAIHDTSVMNHLQEHILLAWSQNLPISGDKPSCKYVTEFAKRGLIHAPNFPTLTNHNFIFKQAIKLNFSVLLVQ